MVDYPQEIIELTELLPFRIDQVYDTYILLGRNFEETKKYYKVEVDA